MFIDHGHLGYDAYLFVILKFSLGRMLYAKKIMLFFMYNIWEREKKNQTQQHESTLKQVISGSTWE